jgi:opacity protein-like surface antigen
MRAAAFLLTTLTIALGVTRAGASDFNPFGVYVGAAIGSGRDAVDNDDGAQLAEHATGWKLMAGLRPISVVGAEVDYIDFGSSSTDAYLVQAKTHAHAAALFAMGYLPIPVPFLDIFAKAGWMRTHTTVSGALSCAPPALCILSLNQDRTDADFAYGGGVQAKFQSLAFRAEYERTATSLGHPNLLSLGIIWTF